MLDYFSSEEEFLNYYLKQSENKRLDVLKKIDSKIIKNDSIKREIILNLDLMTKINYLTNRDESLYFLEYNYWYYGLESDLIKNIISNLSIEEIGNFVEKLPKYITSYLISSLKDDKYLQKKLVNLNIEYIRYCSDYEILSNKELLKYYVPSEEDLKYNNYLRASYEIMKNAIERDVSMVKYIGNNFEDLISKAIDNGYIPTSNDFENNQQLRWIYPILKKAIMEDVNLIKYIDRPYEDLILLACLRGYKFNEEDLKNDYIKSSIAYKIFKDSSIINSVDDLIKIYRPEAIEKLKDLIIRYAIKCGYQPDLNIKHFKKSTILSSSSVLMKWYIENGREDLLQYYTGDNEILRSFISKGNHLSYDIIRYFKSYDSKIFNDPIVNEEYISMLKELGVLMPDEEMIELGKFLTSGNDEIFRTLNFKLLTPKYIELFKDSDENGKVIYPSLRVIGRYEEEQEKILNIDDEFFDLFKTLFKRIIKGDYDYSTLLYKVINNINNSDNKKLLSSVISKFNEYEKDKQEELLSRILFILSKDDPRINGRIKLDNVNDLFDYEINIESYCDDIFANPQLYNVSKISEAVILKEYGLTYDEALKLVSRFATDFNYGDLILPEYDKKIIVILETLKNLVECDDKELLLLLEEKANKSNDNKNNFDFEIISRFEAEIRKMYARSFNQKLLNVNNLKQVTGIPPEIKQPVYMAFDSDNPKEFGILLTALGSYTGSFWSPENYKNDWLRAKDISHAFCTSYISNQMMGTANITHACFGFDNIPEANLLLQAPFDIVSSEAILKKDTADFIDDDRVQFLFPDSQINYTRHTHNELVIERLIKSGKILPSYAIFMTEEFDYDRLSKYNYDYFENKYYLDLNSEEKDAYLWLNALKAARDLDIPVVVLERKKVRDYEKNKINNMFNEFQKGNDDASKIIRDVFLRFENNRAGSREYYNLDGFKASDAKNLIDRTMIELEKMEADGKDKLVIECIDSLIDWLCQEVSAKRSKKGSLVGKKELGFSPYEFNQRLRELKNRIQEKKFPDKNIYNWNTILELIANDNLDINSLDKQIELLNNNNFNLESNSIITPLKQYSIEKMKSMYYIFNSIIKEALDDKDRKIAYSEFNSSIHSDRHIENVVMFAIFLGINGIDGRNKNRLLQLVIEASKYHDCGRIDDGNSNHAVVGALKAYEILKNQNKYKPIELAIIYTAIYNHEFFIKGLNINLADDRRVYLKKLQDKSNIIFKNAFMNIIKGNLPNADITYTDDEYDRCLHNSNYIGRFNVKNVFNDLSQVVTCLRDADALDRTRFINKSSASLNQNYLSEEAKKYIDFSYRLAEVQAICNLNNIVKNKNITIEQIQDVLINPDKYYSGIKPKTPKELIKFIISFVIDDERGVIHGK